MSRYGVTCVLTALKAAPLRIASLDMPVPFAPELEHEFRPTKETIIDRIAELVAKARKESLR